MEQFLIPELKEAVANVSGNSGAADQILGRKVPTDWAWG